MEYYLEIKIPELLIYATAWMNLKVIMLSEKKKLISKGYIPYNYIYV